MSKRNRDVERKDGPAMERRVFVSSSTLQALTFAGVAVLLFMSVQSWSEGRRLQSTLNERLTQLETRMTQISGKLDSGAAARAAAPPARRGPDPNRVYTVNIEGAPYKGPKDAPVTIVTFSDFQCPFCSRVTPTMAQIEKVYKDKVKVVWKNNPLEFHKDAPLAHLAAMAAFEQGKFWPYHDKLFGNQPKIQREFLMQYARELGLDMKRFEASLNRASGQEKIKEDIAEAAALGATGTPAFFINGRFLSGAKPFTEFAQVINAELQRLKLPLPSGATAGG